ncbi:hypothetical protein M5D96_004942, partial [Drosophila gunungcola]
AASNWLSRKGISAFCCLSSAATFSLILIFLSEESVYPVDTYPPLTGFSSMQISWPKSSASLILCKSDCPGRFKSTEMRWLVRWSAA